MCKSSLHGEKIQCPGCRQTRTIGCQKTHLGVLEYDLVECIHSVYIQKVKFGDHWMYVVKLIEFFSQKKIADKVQSATKGVITA